MSHSRQADTARHAHPHDDGTDSNALAIPDLGYDALHHLAGSLDFHSLESFFVHFSLGQVITMSGMKVLTEISKRDARSHEAISRAARELKTMHISITYSSFKEGKQLANVLSDFLNLCFPDGYEYQDHRDRKHQTMIVVTLYPHQNLEEGLDPDLPLVLIEFEALAKTAVANHALAPAEKNAARGYTLQLNVQLPRDGAFEGEWDPLLEHVEGVDLTMYDCRQIAHSVESSARFLILRMGAEDEQLSSYKMVHDRFPHVHDLHLEVPDQSALWVGLSEYFQEVTKLSLKVPSLETAKLSKLNRLHTLRIWSGKCPQALDLQLPANLQNLAIELEVPDHKKYPWLPIPRNESEHSAQALNLTSKLREHLLTLTQLKSIEIRHCDLLLHEGTVLQFFPATLVSLDLWGSFISNKKVEMGKPHHQLHELHIGALLEGRELTSGLHLRALSCTWHVFKNTHHHHLRVLWIGCTVEGMRQMESFKDYSSLTELWIEIDFLTKSAIRQLCGGDALEILPSTLDILVIDGDHFSRNARPWQLRPMTRLRSLGLHADELNIEREGLPPFLHTLAVRHTNLKAARTILGGGMHQLTTIDKNDWRRGPIPGRFLSSYPKDETSASLDDLQARQRMSEARHHHHS